MEHHEPLLCLNRSNLNFQIPKDIIVSQSLEKCLEEGKRGKKELTPTLQWLPFPTVREMLCVREASVLSKGGWPWKGSS